MKHLQKVAEVVTIYLKRKWEKNRIRSLNIYAEFIDVPSKSKKALEFARKSKKLGHESVTLNILLESKGINYKSCF